MNTVNELAAEVGVAPACKALAVSRATWYRRQAPPVPWSGTRVPPSRALSQPERSRIIDAMTSPRFVDRSPAEAVATLLEEGVYLGSERTVYRVLAAEQLVRERRSQRAHPAYERPELVASEINQVWSWDITKLLGPQKWTYYYLYVIMDLFSRYIVGWMLADRENATLASTLIEQSCVKHGVAPGTLVLHSDRGSPMTAKCTAQLLADLGVTQSLSRPQVSDDNPYSESNFKTLKYHPMFPRRFNDIEHARSYCRTFFPWYCDEHRHGGIAMLTPADVFHGRSAEVLARRQRTLDAAYAANPRRFVGGPPVVAQLPTKVWINKPADQAAGTVPVLQ